MFRSYDHPQVAYIVPCKSYSLKTLSDLHRYVELVLWQPVLCESHATRRTTHIHSQAHSEQYTTHTSLPSILRFKRS